MANVRNSDIHSTDYSYISVTDIKTVKPSHSLEANSGLSAK